MTAVAQWMDRALCVGADPDVWFDADTRDEAQRICRMCPVAAACRAAWPDAYRGVWGGEVHKAKHPGPSPTAEYLGVEHGTEQSYRQHLATDQIPCDRCLVAHRFANREREETRERAVYQRERNQ